MSSEVCANCGATFVLDKKNRRYNRQGVHTNLRCKPGCEKIISDVLVTEWPTAVSSPRNIKDRFICTLCLRLLQKIQFANEKRHETRTEFETRGKEYLFANVTVISPPSEKREADVCSPVQPRPHGSQTTDPKESARKDKKEPQEGKKKRKKTAKKKKKQKKPAQRSKTVSLTTNCLIVSCSCICMPEGSIKGLAFVMAFLILVGHKLCSFMTVSKPRYLKIQMDFQIIEKNSLHLQRKSATIFHVL